MPNRYWVGGDGTWSSTNTTNWSATSGGTGGASVPTFGDDVFIDSNSGTTNLVITTASGYTARCYTLSMTRGTLQPAFSSTQDLVIGAVSGGATSGSFSITGGLVWYFRTIQIYGSTFGPPSPVYLPNNNSVLGDIEFVAGSAQLTANLSPVPGSSTLIKGGATLDISGRSVTVSFIEVESSGTLLSSSSTLTTSNFILRSGAIFNPSGISLLSVSQEFTDLGSTSRTYPSVAFTGTVTVDVPASVTFTTLQLAGMLVKAGQTIYVGAITSVSSSVGLLSTSDSPGQFTLSSPSGTKTLPFLAISNCNATGGATWVAPSSSSDMGNNTNIQFANSRGLLAFFT